MIFSIIQKSQLEGAQRIDAEYYQPEYLSVYKALTRLNTVSLSEFCKISDGDHSKIPGFVESDGVRYLRAKDLQNFFIDDSDPVYVAKDYFKKLKRSHIKPLDIVLSIMGTVGNLAIVFPEYGIITANRAVSIISPRSQDLYSTYFLAIYLESKFGVTQRERESMGGVQQRVNLDDLAKIKIPIIPKSHQDEIIAIFKQAIDQYENSKSYYSQAENLLLEELGMRNFQPRDEISYLVNFSNIKSAKRMDAEYFQPKFDKINSAVKSYKGGWSLLEDVTNLIGHPSNPPYETKDSRNKTFIITQKHLADYFPEDKFWDDKEGLYTTDEFIEKNKQYLLEDDDIILYSVGAYIGKANLYNSKIKATIGSFLTLIRAKKDVINPFYLLTFLNSSVGQLLTRRNSRGLAQQYIYPYDTKTIPIPKLDTRIQEEIQTLIIKGHEARKKSKELLEEAKRKVEEMIEKGGN